MQDGPPNGPQPRLDQERAETYSPNEAADVLDLSKRVVLQVSERRELIGEQNPETGRWSILKAHVEAFREYREKTARKKPKTTPSENSSPSRELVDALRVHAAAWKQKNLLPDHAPSSPSKRFTEPPGDALVWGTTGGAKRLLAFHRGRSYVVDSRTLGSPKRAGSAGETSRGWSEEEVRSRMHAVFYRARQAANFEKINFNGQLVDPRYKFTNDYVIEAL
jgi:hypothetical protein